MLSRTSLVRRAAVTRRAARPQFAGNTKFRRGDATLVLQDTAAVEFTLSQRLMAPARAFARFGSAYPFLTNVVLATAKMPTIDLLVQVFAEKKNLTEIDWKRNFVFTAFGFCYLGCAQWAIRKCRSRLLVSRRAPPLLRALTVFDLLAQM